MQADSFVITICPIVDNLTVTDAFVKGGGTDDEVKHVGIVAANAIGTGGAPCAISRSVLLGLKECVHDAKTVGEV